MDSINNPQLTAQAYVTGALTRAGAVIVSHGTPTCLHTSVYRIEGLGLIKVQVDMAGRDDVFERGKR